MKKCSRCEKEKALDDFATYSGKPWYWCRECQRESNRLSRAKKPRDYAAEARKYRAKYPGRDRERQRAWRLKVPEKIKDYYRRDYQRRKAKFVEWNRARNLKKNYGVTIEQYEAMYRAQNGACAICQGMNLSGRRLAVDHDHKTGKIRGLLCSKCNSAIGLFKDDLNLMRRAFEYIEGVINVRP